MITKIVELNRDLVTVKLDGKDYLEIMYISNFIDKINKQLQND
jgi:hypothetical protein